MTYQHITNPLERKILANALNVFRLYFKQPMPSSNQYIIFLSEAVCGVFDECVIEVKTWKLKEVNYTVWVGKHIVMKTIPLS